MMDATRETRHYPVFHVDDDERALAALRRAVRPLGVPWELTSFRSPEDAFSAVTRTGIVVLLTDWVMPSVDGVTLCRRIREHEHHASGYAYIILLTGKQEVANLVHALDAGADDFLSKPYDTRELEARVRAGARVVELQRKLREANVRLEQLAMTDGLTGLLNRRRGDETIDEHLDLVNRGKQDISILLLDLNKFKEVNDTHGHEAGDRLLVAVADRLRSACRQYDSVIRWGGDEFLVLCPHTSAEEAHAVAARVRAAVSLEPVRVHDDVWVTPEASVGLASAYAGHRVAPATLVAAADQAMYAEKARRRSSFPVTIKEER
jgi:two-component system chemotaxis response regulator CheY